MYQQVAFEGSEVLFHPYALLFSLHEGFQFGGDFDVGIQYFVYRPFELGGVGGFEASLFSINAW